MIFNPNAINKIYIVKSPVDFRQSINGLGAIAKYTLKIDIFNQNLIIFCNKRKDKIKMLYWDGNGFILMLKRLEIDKFKWVTDLEDKSVSINSQQLELLLKGLEITEYQDENSVKKYKIN